MKNAGTPALAPCWTSTQAERIWAVRKDPQADRDGLVVAGLADDSVTWGRPATDVLTMFMCLGDNSSGIGDAK